MGKILMIEDERAICDIVTFNLIKEGHEVVAAYDGQDGIDKALAESYDLILLDVMLPKLDGWGVLRQLREKKSTPVIMLTAREEEIDKIQGLELGADDYITKPFSLNELKARIKSNIRRATSYSAAEDENPSQEEEVRGLKINLTTKILKRDDTTIELSGREFSLFSFLYKNKGKVFSREELLEQVWEYEGFLGDLRAVDVMVRRLREKIEKDPSDPDLIKTRRGMGYYLEG